MTPKKEKKKRKKRKRLEKFKNRNRFGLRWRGKGKSKQKLTVVKAHYVCIAYLIMHVGMKPFPQKSWPKSYGQSSGKKLTQNKEGFLPRSRLADGILIKFPRLLPLKSSPLCRTLRLTRKSILIKKLKKKKAKWYSFDVYFHSSTIRLHISDEHN